MAVQNKIMQGNNVGTSLGVTIPETINSADLTKNTTTPKITQTQPSTAGAGMLGAVESSQDQFTKTMEERRKELETARDTSLKDYTTRLFEGPTEAGTTAQEYEKQGVNRSQRELDDINSQLQVEQHALRREIERIQDNAVGASMGQVQNMVREAENKSIRRQADLSVIQMGLQGKFNTAKAIADRAVDAVMEREKNIITALKTNYEDNKALFTTAEQREFETLVSNRERAYDAEIASKKAISDYSIEAMKIGADGATITAIRSAKTPEEAQAIASEYTSGVIQSERDMERQTFNLDMELKRAQLAKAKEREVKLAPTDIIEVDGRKVLVNTQTGEILKEFTAGEDAGEMKTALAKDFVSTIEALKTDKGITRAVGEYGISRFTPFTPDKSEVNNFIASINQMTGTLTLNNLIDAKSRGATFGALSIPELNMLAQSATKINTWARNASGEKVNPETDLVHHYEISEKEMKKELDKISNFGKLDYVLKGGNPVDVGVQQMEDRTYWTKNSDGSMTKIR